MSLVTGTIQGGGLSGTDVAIEIPTVRVPELTAADTPQGSDLLVLYQEAGNVTRSVDLDSLRDYIVTGGNPAALTPVNYGADVEIVITAQMARQSRVNVPVLANEMFSLQRVGTGPVPLEEFKVLSSGGFELQPKNAEGKVVDVNDPTGIPQTVKEGEIFVAHVYNLAPQTINNSVSLLDGIASIPTNTQLSIQYRRKLIHCAFGTVKGTITLEDISDAPANSLVIIETMITNQYDTRIQTKSGQAIYFQNTSQTFLYLAKAEFIWLLRGDDGWYVINASVGLLNVGDVNWGYKEKLNTLVCKGQLVNRADYPRLWQWVQSTGFSLVEETTWQSSVTISGAADGTRQSYRPYEGCFSYGPEGVSGSTFRLPNLQEKFVRGLNNIDGVDAQRSFNKSGSIQPDDNRKHNHTTDPIPVSGGSGDTNKFTNKDNTPTNDKSGTGYSGGYESRGINVGLLPLINI